MISAQPVAGLSTRYSTVSSPVLLLRSFVAAYRSLELNNTSQGYLTVGTKNMDTIKHIRVHYSTRHNNNNNISDHMTNVQLQRLLNALNVNVNVIIIHLICIEPFLCLDSLTVL